ncbi:hypothetical protein C9374_013285 [Naegleria lovaniensis]|uniref:Ribosomal protein L29 n=2 Tax=Naegleria TaxID=5761 RepID=A0AA88GYZ5_NAELO|nr:uncharacterized protein C9374_013285 [Naegleria lovaniensis]XP_044564959.1 uncharacterized protein FDP41_013460 [Naegleria fowleri]KAF0980246.1 hypothetical protein FDP41_013460 [Naegleria fowleri]KAG2391800.1 hypothetical protein C9374_013285 [Naegleria lovaniensis]CAG4711349.1 unnamed protein product [Naegleria fowleri]
MVQKVKAFELRTKTNDELKKQLDSMKQELFQLRVQKVTGASAANLLNIKVIRKNIARIKTVLVQKQRDELKKVYANAKFKPKDLRSKQTRAFRRTLKTYQLKKKLLKTQKKEANFPVRRFAVTLQ